jgi:DNA-binding NarL/FixJ family response regulator
MGTPIRVALVATFPLFHEGLVRVLREDPSLEVADERFTCEELVACTTRRNYDLAIIHIRDGFSPHSWQTAESLCAEMKVIVLLKHHNLSTVTRALELGVTGILTEAARCSAIFEAIHEVAAGSVWCEPGPPPPAMGHGLPKPSGREREVLTLIRQGLSNRDIGTRLYISERTVKSHVNHLLQKFQVKNRVQLALSTYEEWEVGSESSAHSPGPG